MAAAGIPLTVVVGLATPVSANLAAAGNWSDDPLPSGPIVPIFCEAATTVEQGTNGDDEALATAACTDSEDTFSYQWTWVDETTGGVLASGGSTLNNARTVSSASGTNLGIPGHRQATICFTTAKTGYQTGSSCLVLQHV